MELSHTIEPKEPDWLFKTNQIVCLEYQSTCLYGEVIQLIPSRGMCWFRPIGMTKEDVSGDLSLQIVYFAELESADLLWPTTLFRPAWDTEVLFLLTELGSRDELQPAKSSSSQHLHQFVKEVWAANQDRFA